MKGKELYIKLSNRDYSGSDQDKYAQLLQTIHNSAFLNDELPQFYQLLEKAEAENKKIDVNDLQEEIFISDLVLV